MSRCVLVFFFGVFYISAVYAQTKLDKLNKIRVCFQKINADSSLKSLTLEGEDFLDQTPDGGASLTGYFKNKSLVKISEWIGLSFGIKQVDYYFDNKKFIFAYAVEKQFKRNDSTGTMDFTSTENKFEGRFYYDDNILIERKIKGAVIFGDIKEFEKQIVEDAKTYSNLLYSKREKK